MLDPEIAALLDIMAQSGAPPLHMLDPADAKSAYKASRTALTTPDRPDVIIRDINAETSAGVIPVRLYRPAGADHATLPALIFYHGGGFTIGDLDTHDGVCQTLCAQAGIVVVSVDYRLAPEHRFPAAVDDCYAALEWVSDQAAELAIDPARLAVGGDSAGGCLSAVIALLARDRAGPQLRLQLLIYPTTDASHDMDSHRRNGSGYVLTVELLHYFRDLYLTGPDDIADWRVSPLRAPDHSHLPPAWILIAGYDPLADEADAYAARLDESGVAVTIARYPGQIHGFITMGKIIPQAIEALNEAAAALKRALA